MTDMDWLMYANIAVWIGLGAYLAFLIRNQIASTAALPSWRPCAMTDQTFGKNRRSILLLITELATAPISVSRIQKKGKF